MLKSIEYILSTSYIFNPLKNSTTVCLKINLNVIAFRIQQHNKFFKISTKLPEKSCNEKCLELTSVGSANNFIASLVGMQ
jgi:hypothetical protein